jgi:hypothetical protein
MISALLSIAVIVVNGAMFILMMASAWEFGVGLRKDNPGHYAKGRKHAGMFLCAFALSPIINVAFFASLLS